MIRPVLAVMAGLLCALAGFRYGGEIKEGGSRFQRWAEILTHLSLLMREGAGSLTEVLNRCAGEDTLPDRLMRSLAEHLRENPLSTPEEGFELSGLTDREREPLRRLMGRLGRGSRESRCQAVDQCAREMALLASSAREHAERDSRMWRQLALLMGACLTLWLI